MVSIQVDTSEVERSLGQFKTEVPFATARAINDTLLAIQTKEVKGIHDRFTIRRAAFVKRSVKITEFAKKDTLKGTVGIADMGGKKTSDILSKFEAGGRKAPSGGGHIAVPTANIKPDTNKVVARGKRPRNLKNAFKVVKGGDAFLFQRKGKGKKATVALAYVLKSSVKIDKRLSFIDTAVHTFNAEFEKNVNTRLDEGIAKARLKG